MNNPCRECIVKSMCRRACGEHIGYVSTNLDKYKFKSAFCTEISLFMKDNPYGKFLFFDGISMGDALGNPPGKYRAIKLKYNKEGDVMLITGKGDES